VVEGGTWQIQQMLEQGELDIGIIAAEFLPDSLEAHSFLREQMLVCVSREHPLANQSSVSYKQFFAEELVLFKDGYFHRKVTDRIARQHGLTPKIGFETNLIPLIQAIVRQGFGISALLNRAIEGVDEIVGIPFEQPVLLDLAIAWRKEGYLSKANQAFLDFLLANTASDDN
jgi:DNA-binding transcriptional LysR family regulator